MNNYHLYLRSCNYELREPLDSECNGERQGFLRLLVLARTRSKPMPHRGTFGLLAVALKNDTHLVIGFAVSHSPQGKEWCNGKVAESAGTECLNSGGFT